MHRTNVAGAGRLRAVAAGLVAGAVVLGVGVAIGRATGGGASAPPAARTPAAPATGPGPTRVEAGVPVGYAHTQAGAVAAATNFAEVELGPLVTDPEKYRAATAVLAAPSVRDDLVRQGEGVIALLNNTYQLVTNAHRGVAVGVRSYPLSYHVDSYAGDTAAVRIWAVAVIAEQGVGAPTALWDTGTYSLTWVGGDWRLLDLRSTHGSFTPQVPGNPSPAPVVPPELTSFEQYSHAPR